MHIRHPLKRHSKGQESQKADLGTKSNHGKGDKETLWTSLKSSSPNKICEWPEAELNCGSRRLGRLRKETCSGQLHAYRETVCDSFAIPLSMLSKVPCPWASKGPNVAMHMRAWSLGGSATKGLGSNG